MWGIALLSFLAGALLASQRKVFVLVPSLGVALPLVAWIGLARGEGLSSLILDMVLTASCAEAGYVARLVGHAFMAATPSGETRCRFPACDCRDLRDAPPVLSGCDQRIASMNRSAPG